MDSSIVEEKELLPLNPSKSPFTDYLDQSSEQAKAFLKDPSVQAALKYLEKGELPEELEWLNYEHQPEEEKQEEPPAKKLKKDTSGSLSLIPKKPVSAKKAPSVTQKKPSNQPSPSRNKTPKKASKKSSETSGSSSTKPDTPQKVPRSTAASLIELRDALPNLVCLPPPSLSNTTHSTTVKVRNSPARFYGQTLKLNLFLHEK